MAGQCGGECASARTGASAVVALLLAALRFARCVEKGGGPVIGTLAARTDCRRGISNDMPLVKGSLGGGVGGGREERLQGLVALSPRALGDGLARGQIQIASARGPCHACRVPHVELLLLVTSIARKEATCDRRVPVVRHPTNPTATATVLTLWLLLGVGHYWLLALLLLLLYYIISITN